MKLAVTGATGFIGRILCGAADAAGHDVVRIGRTGRPGVIAVGGIDGRTEWGGVLAGVEVVMHLAARAHVMRESAPDPLAAFRLVNRDGTRRLAEAAAACGVRRLVFVSTIKVLGEATTEVPFRESDPPAPADPYARSKHEAERALDEVARTTGLEVVTVRPALVTGPGAGGNLRRMMGLVRRGIPLPLAGIDNRRSLTGVQNLASLLLRVAAGPEAIGRALLVADQPAISSAELVRLMAESMGRSPRLWQLPLEVVRALGRVTGRAAEVERLTGSLEVDDRGTRALLGWEPPLTLQEGIRAMVTAFLQGSAA